jgi:hydrogenase/urease accessory protein HupE
VIRWLLLLLALLESRAVHADELRPGYLEFTQLTPKSWHLVWKAPMKGGITPATQPVLPKGCNIDAPLRREIDGQSLITRASVYCAGDVAGNRIGLSNMATSQTDILVRIAPLNRPVQALRLTAAAPKVVIARKPARFQVARTYLVSGIEHILSGYDHLLFVFALVLLLNGFWIIFKAATAFTLAHSITLIGTTLGLMGLPQRPVESVIALSIVFLAVELAKRQPGQPRLAERMPWAVAFLFGLLHGFGFAGALNEIGLPEGEVLTALLTFNLGVEIGQVAIVAVILALLAALRRWTPILLEPAVKMATWAIGIIASFWFIERTLG